MGVCGIVGSVRKLMFFLFEMIEGVLLIINIEVVIEDTISGGRR